MDLALPLVLPVDAHVIVQQTVAPDVPEPDLLLDERERFQVVPAEREAQAPCTDAFPPCVMRRRMGSRHGDHNIHDHSSHLYPEDKRSGQHDGAPAGGRLTTSWRPVPHTRFPGTGSGLSLIHISEPTRL